MGTEIILVIISSVFVFALLIFIFTFVLKYQRKTLSIAKEKELMQSKFDKTLLESQLEIQEQTLQHISTELHDNLGQIGSLIKINLHSIPLENPQKAAEKLADTIELTRNLMMDIRSISRSLDTDRIGRIGLMKVLESEIERINKTEQFVAIFEYELSIIPIENNKAIILYRMVQEIFNNIIKHSGAKNIWMNITGGIHSVALVIRDDGKGFDVTEKITNGSGAGLGNLQKRASLINANLSVVSETGKGSCTTIELLLNQEHDN